MDKFDLSARATELRSKIVSWEEDWKLGARRLGDLVEEIAALEKRHVVVVEGQERLDAKIAEARAELERIEALAPESTKPAPSPKPAVAAKNEGQIRAAILRFEKFTLADFAAYLRVPPRTALQYLEAEQEKGVVQPTGEVWGRSPVWEYTPPTDPGNAFKVQQEQRDREPSPDVVYAQPVAGVGEGYLSSLPKDVRKEARIAIKDGWTLMPAGSGHYQLVRDGITVSISSTPQSPSAEARMLRRRLNGAGMTSTRRGAPVPGTGKPVGSSGRPGFDAERARQGKRVVRKGQR